MLLKPTRIYCLDAPLNTIHTNLIGCKPNNWAIFLMGFMNCWYLLRRISDPEDPARRDARRPMCLGNLRKRRDEIRVDKKTIQYHRQQQVKSEAWEGSFVNHCIAHYLPISFVKWWPKRYIKPRCLESSVRWTFTFFWRLGRYWPCSPPNKRDLILVGCLQNLVILGIAPFRAGQNWVGSNQSI